MKTYRDFITEAATAKAKSKKNFKKKWNKLLDSPAWQKAPDNVAQWHLTGHNADARHGSTKEVEKTKEKIFGKRKGNSHLFWIHSHHGLITHPAHGDIVHNDVELSPRKGIKVDKNIRKKVKDTSGLIVGLGRIEHHEGGGGMISYGHIGGSTRSAAVRTIARAYPKHKIHDGHGNLLENWSYAHDFHEMPNSEKQKYVYHVTTAARAAKIVKGGLKPRSPKGRTNYPSQKEHTQGHAFVTNHHGVGYWVDQTAHAVNRRKREVDERDYENIHVVKFPIANLSKSARRKFKSDDLGTKDSRKHSDYARDPIIDPSTHEAPSAFKVRKKIQEAYISKTKDGWIHSRGLGHRRWVKGNHSIEKQGKRGWTVYDWHSSKELHVAKTAKEAKAWSNANRPSHSKMEPIEIKPWTA
jgi:hypothetical protein